VASQQIAASVLAMERSNVTEFIGLLRACGGAGRGAMPV